LAEDGKSGLFELPGLWFNASELHALLSAHHLLSQVEPGILSEEIAPLRRRIRNILQHRRVGSGDLVKRVRIAQTGSRPVDKHRFRQACTALMRRRQLAIDYHARGTDKRTERQVSPQRLTHYRSNWYLDAWCHQRKALRSFAFERIEHLTALNQPAREVTESELIDFSGAYGIFSGPGGKQAILRFTPERARWLAEERWHPDQTARWRPDGHFELTLPYDNPTELIMDILRHGPEVEVIQPPSPATGSRQNTRRNPGELPTMSHTESGIDLQALSYLAIRLKPDRAMPTPGSLRVIGIEQNGVLVWSGKRGITTTTTPPEHQRTTGAYADRPATRRPPHGQRENPWIVAGHQQTRAAPPPI
jgi:proteasome accessory factor C